MSRRWGRIARRFFANGEQLRLMAQGMNPWEVGHRRVYSPIKVRRKRFRKAKPKAGS